jgi:probable biosynthetic protein (TIGR04098 family)
LSPTAAPPLELPDSPRRIRIGMPHLDAGGLSENWLFRYAGDLHWEAIARQLGVTTDQICGDGGERLYPTVVALRARYERPLSAVHENDVLAATVEVLPCGGACAHGRIEATVGGGRLSIELLTTFAQREGRAHPASRGALRMALPAPALTARWTPVGVPPVIARLAKAARRGLPLDDRFSGPALDPHPDRPPLGRVAYEPSPYTDYNGAGLLYFASYGTIADGAERKLVRRLGLAQPRAAAPAANRFGARAPDWALAASPVKRDLFYYGNLPLGETLTAELLDFEPDAGDEGGGAAGVKTRLRLRRERDGRTIADVVTRRRLLGTAP